jgi:hypothetical protein
MRVMVLVKATEDSEKGEYAGHEEEFAAMGTYNEELLKAGIMLAGEGLTPSSQAGAWSSAATAAAGSSTGRSRRRRNSSAASGSGRSRQWMRPSSG